MKVGNLGAENFKEIDFGGREVCDIWEEKDSEDKDEVIAEIEVAIAMAVTDSELRGLLSLLWI